MGLFFGLLRVCGLFRVDAKDEEEGLDHSYHGGSAYGDTAGEPTYNYSKVQLRAERLRRSAVCFVTTCSADLAAAHRTRPPGVAAALESCHPLARRR